MPKIVDTYNPDYPFVEGIAFTDYNSDEEFLYQINKYFPDLFHFEVVSRKGKGTRTNVLLKGNFIKEGFSDRIFYVYIFILHEGGRGRDYEDELRTELVKGSQWIPDLARFKVANTFRDTNEELINKECYCIGIYKQDEKCDNVMFFAMPAEVLCKSEVENINPTSTFQTLGIYVQEAYRKGISIHKKTFNVSHTYNILLFKPEYFLWYMKNRDQLHVSDINSALEIISEASQAKTPRYKISKETPLQQIFYGAPGTGKSYKTNEVSEKYSTIRTTFHPDSDYSTFVGAYKPTTKTEYRFGLNGGTTVALEYPDGEKAGKNITESKIEYRFVKQAFLKAYINAWKLFAEAKQLSFAQHSAVEIRNADGTDSWILDAVEDLCIFYTKESRLEVKRYEDAVKRFWKVLTESDDPDNYGPGTNDMYEGAACIWFRSNNSTNHSVDECWEAIINHLRNGDEIDSNPGGNQTYFISLENDTIIIRTKAKAWRKAISENFGKNEEPSRSSIQIKIAQKLKEYNCSFDDAWNKLKDEVHNNRSDSSEVIDLNSIPAQFLVIEEINRGNCAQIFGDLFQLLDRKNGFSEYPIDADEDIRKCLLSEDTEEDPSFGINGLSFSPTQKMVINGMFNSSDGAYHDIADEIAKGKILVLPCNLYIWATMNTSDQSLFPIDSAFKRRWAWKYVRISEGKKKDGTPLNYRIKFTVPAENEKPAVSVDVPWWDFVKAINKQIEDATKSEDKKLGYFFCKPDKKANEADECNTIISAETFVGKVVFYLWQDVFKDYGFKSDIFKRADKSKISFHDFYPDNITADELANPEAIDLQLVKEFIDKVIEKDKSKEQTAQA